MAKHSKHFNKIIQLLRVLHEKYPNQGVARHISDATADYQNIWGMTDKELEFALEKYKQEMETNVVDEVDIAKIITDGTDLEHILDDVDEDEDDFDV